MLDDMDMHVFENMLCGFSNEKQESESSGSECIRVGESCNTSKEKRSLSHLTLWTLPSDSSSVLQPIL